MRFSGLGIVLGLCQHSPSDFVQLLIVLFGRQEVGQEGIALDGQFRDGTERCRTMGSGNRATRR